MKKDIRHQPLKGILDRDLEIANAQSIINQWSPYLEELCNYSSNLLGRCQNSMTGVDGTPSTLIVLYYHIIQMADGINAASSQSCFDAVIPMLRSLWEGALSIEYILQDAFARRSTAWMVCCHMNTKSFLESLDPTTVKGKSIQGVKRQDKVHQHIDFLHRPPTGISIALRDVDQKLRKKKFKTVLDDLTSDTGKLMKWHSIDKGPRNLEQLAYRLGKPLEYEFLYRYFSEISHAHNTTHATVQDQGKHFMAQMRNASGAETVYKMSTTYLINAAELIAAKLRPGEEVHDETREILKRHRPEVTRSLPGSQGT